MIRTREVSIAAASFVCALAIAALAASTIENPATIHNFISILRCAAPPFVKTVCCVLHQMSSRPERFNKTCLEDKKHHGWRRVMAGGLQASRWTASAG